MIVFVTGGAGFIGQKLAAALGEAGHDVTAFDNLNVQVHRDPQQTRVDVGKTGAQLVVGDVRDREGLGAVLADVDPDIVVHLASDTGTGQSYDLPVRYCDVNVLGTASLLEAVRHRRQVGGRVRRVVLAGSRAVYGEGACRYPDGRAVTAVPRTAADLKAGDYSPKDAAGTPLTPIPSAAARTQPAPASVYASTKLMQEHLLAQCLEQTGIEHVVLRLQNVYGPGQSLQNPYTGVLSIFMQKLLSDEVIDVYEDGQIVRDFVYVSDAAAAFRRVCEMERVTTTTIDIGSGTATTIAHVAEMMIEVLSLAGDRYRVTGQFRPGDVRHALADRRLAADLLSWRPEVDLREGMAALANWAQATQ